MKKNIIRDTTPHNWFAWRPVLAEQKTPAGLVYFWVWLEAVNRRYLRVGGMSQWVYTTETK